MKLHLPPGLHAALLIGFAAAATIGSTYATGALTDGTFEAAFDSLISAITPRSSGAELDGDIAPEPEPLIKDFPQGGTISNRDYANYQQLTVSGGTLQVDYSSESGEGFTSGEVAVGGGANLLLNGQNALGTGEGKVSKLSLAGESEEAMASVEVANRNSLASPFSMNGYSSVTPTTEAGVLEIPEAEDINVTGPKNHIATDIALFAPLSVTVTKDDAGQGDLTISGKITAATENAGMNIAGDGELTLSGADSTLGAVANNGNLVIGASMSTSAYDASGTGSLKVANGAVFTIDSLTNTEQGAMWNVMTAWDADVGDTGLIVLKGGFNATTFDYDPPAAHAGHHINGRYQVNGDMSVVRFNVYNASAQVYLNQDAYLHVNGNLTIGSGSTMHVRGGEMVVDEKIILGVESTGAGYYGVLSLEGDDAKVSVNGISFCDVGIECPAGLVLTGGTLSIGAEGIKTDGDYSGKIELLGGTLVTGEGWSSEADVSATLGAVTIGSASTGAAVFEGDITFTDTVINQNGIVNDEATQGLVLRDSTLTVRVQDLINLDADLENGLDSDTNGLISQRYWLVRNEGENAKLTLADGAVAVVGEHQYTVDADGSFVATNHQTYALNVGSEQYSAIRDAGAGLIRLNDGVTLNVDADAVEMSLSLAGSAVISTDRDTHISGHILHSGASDLDKDLTLNLTGTAALSGNVNLGDGTGVLTVASGTLYFGNADNASAINTMRAKEIVVNSGAQFTLYHSGDTEDMPVFQGVGGSATNLTLNGSTFYVRAIDRAPDSAHICLGTLTVSGETAALDGEYGSHLVFDTLTGSGKLTLGANINATWGSFVTKFGILKDFNGELVATEKSGAFVSPSMTVINGATQSETSHAIITNKTYSEGDFVMSGTGSLTLDDHESAGSFDVQGGKVTMQGDVVLNEGAGTLSISNGEVHFGNPLSTNKDSATNTLRASEIVIGAGGKLTFYHACDAASAPVFQGTDGAATNLTLNGGTFYVQSMGDDPDKASVAFGSLTVNGDSALDGRYRGHVTVDSLSGSGKLTLGGSADGTYGRFWVTVDSLTDFNGELVAVNKTSQLGVCKTYLNSAQQSGTNDATITGKTYSEGDFVKTGTGSLTLGDHESAGSFDVQGGKVTMKGNVVLNEGAGTLSISNGEVHFGNPLSSDNVNATNTLKAAEISIGSGGKLTFYHSGDATGAPVFQGADGAATNLTLNDGTFFMQAMGGSDTIAMGTLTVSGESALDGKFNGRTDFASLTGCGKLTVAASVNGAWGRYTTSFASLNNFDGELVVKDAKPGAGDVTGYTRTYISNVHLDKELETTITGKSYSEGNLSKTGEGSLVLGAHESAGSFDVQGGTVTMTGDVSLDGGAGTLTVNAGSVSAHAGTKLSASEIIVEDGATFSIEGTAQASAFTAITTDGAVTDVTLHGGTLAKLGADAAQASFGVLEADDGSAVSMENAGSLEVGTLWGSGTLTITQNASGTSTFTVGILEDYDGKIVLAGSNEAARTYINGVDLGRRDSVVIEAQGELGTYSADGFVKEGAGNMTLSRHTAEGSFTIIDEGAVTVTDSLDVSGATVLEDGSLTIAQGATVSLADLEIKGGELHLNSAISAKDGFSLTQTGGTIHVAVGVLQGLEHTGLAASEYSSNGWGATKYTLISGTNLNIGEGAQVMVDGTAYDLSADGTFNCAIEGERYYIVNANALYQKPSDSGIGSAREIVLKGKGLNLSGSLGAATSIVVEKSGVVDVGMNATLVDTQVMINAGTALNLHGKGVYQVTQLERFTLGSTEQTGKSVLNFAGWQGTVLMDSIELSGQNLSNYATSSSAVELRDVEGWLAAGTHTPAVALTGKNTMTASEGAVTFAGSVRGTGSLEHAADDASAAAYTFSGDVADWSGDFRIAEEAGAAQLSFTGEAKVINANISGGSTEASRLSLELANDEAVEVNGALTGCMDVTYSGAGAKTVGNAASDYTGSTEITGGEVVVADAAAFGQSAVSVTAGALKVGAFSLDNTVTAGDATIAKLAEASVDYAQVQVTAEALSSMTDGATLSNAHISVAKDGAYAINNVELSNTKLTVAGALTMDASSLDGAMLAENVELNVEATGSIATLNGPVGVFGGEHSVTLGELTDDGMEGDYTMRSTNQLSGLVLAGDTSFSVDLSSVADSLAEDPYIGLVFSGLSVLGDTATPHADGDVLLTDSLGKYFTLTGADGYSLSKVESDGENTVLYVVNAAAVPEPTTATLSLLALSMLAARRRRK